MNKKKFVVLTLLLVVIFTLTTCLLVACDTDVDDDVNQETVEATEGLLISNGDFKVVDTSDDAYPRRITSWTGAKMYSSGDFRDDVIAGAINLDETSYAANKATWSDNDDTIKNLLKKGDSYGNDDNIKNALMIYMPEEGTDNDGNKIHGATAYGFTSSSFTLAKGSYYKLTVDVLTYNIQGDADCGARIYISSATYAEAYGIKTDGAWRTYEFYLESSPTSSTNLSVMLGLGKYSSSFTTGKTTGYAFFDNVVLKKLTDDEVATDDVANEHVANPSSLFREKEYAELAQQQTAPQNGVYTITATLKVPNGHFEFGSSTRSQSGAPNLWSHVTGNSGKGDDAAPASIGINATLDTAKIADEFQNYSGTYYYKSLTDSVVQSFKPASHLEGYIDAISSNANKLGKNIFMLSQQLMTAQGIKTSGKITIEKGKSYVISLDVYTVGIHGAGVSLILSGSDGPDIEIKGISAQKSSNVFIGNRQLDPNSNYSTFVDGSDDGNSTNAWQTYKFYIKGNPYIDYSYNMEVWLGTGGNSDNRKVSYRRCNSSGTESTVTTYDANGTYANGWVFLDEFRLKEREYDAAPDETHLYSDGNTLDLTESGDSYKAISVDLSEVENLFGDNESNVLADAQASNSSSLKDEHRDDVTVIGKGAPTGWESHFFDAEGKNKPLIKDIIKEGVVNISTQEAFNGIEGLENAVYPDIPYNMPNKNAYAVFASSDSRFEVETADITIAKNTFYRISLWVKTVDVKSTSGIKIYLLDKTEDSEADPDKYEEKVLKSTSSFINTTDYDEYFNDWCEVKFYIRGSVEEDKTVSLKFTFGEGDKFNTSTLTSGAMYLANFNRTEITYSNFTAAGSGSTYQIIQNFASDDAPTYSKFTNGLFDSYDLDDEHMEQNKTLAEQNVAIYPLNWTLSDNTLNANTSESNLFAGVIGLNTADKDMGNSFTSSIQATTATNLDESFFNSFYNDIDTTDPSSETFAEGLGGPNFLAIGSKTADKFAVGFASDSFSLSANTYYSISVWAKTKGQTKATIYLSGEASASGDNKIIINNTADGEWTKYTFYIQVGKTSVSLRLNLWLGEDIKYIANDDGSEGYEQAKEAAKSAGAVFFDNVRRETIEKDEYDAAVNGDGTKVISFMIDSFGAISDDIGQRGSLQSPNGWSGSIDNSALSSSNSRMGVIYADRSGDFFETEEVDGETYVKILGKSYTESDVEYTADELNEAISAADRNDAKYQGMSDDEFNAAIEAELRESKLNELKKNNWLPVSELYTRPQGEQPGQPGQILIINNTVKSAYTYKSSSNTLTDGKMYKISVWVRTYGLSDGEKEGAYIELYLGSANDASNPFRFEAIKANDWTEYTFYVKAVDDDVTSVTINLSLGKYITTDGDNGDQTVTGTTSGYAMFDDVSFVEITDEDEFEKALADAEENEFLLAKEINSEDKGDVNEGEEGTTETPGFNLDYLWWMIPTLVLGLVIIIVLVVFIIRKLRKPGKAADKVVKVEAPQTVQAINEKRERYDEDKE